MSVRVCVYMCVCVCVCTCAGPHQGFSIKTYTLKKGDEERCTEPGALAVSDAANLQPGRSREVSRADTDPGRHINEHEELQS